jgi:2-dehydropantoate 2-reductase
MELNRVAVVGAGAVGCYFGGMLARAGTHVVLIGRAVHMDAIASDGLFLEGLSVNERIRVETASDIAAVRDAQVVLLCVKTLDTETAAREIQPQLAPSAAVLSMQNGVDNVARIRAATGIDAIPVVVYVAAAMAGPGHVKHSGRGDLVLPESAREIAARFDAAGIPCRLSAAIEAELWKKMVMNCGYNAISALGRAQYGRMAQTPRIRALIGRAIAETVAVARADGVDLPEGEMVEAAQKLGEAMSGATSSTAQDIARGKRTEIESLNGYVARRGAEAGIATPVNETLCALVQLLEESAWRK